MATWAVILYGPRRVPGLKAISVGPDYVRKGRNTAGISARDPKDAVLDSLDDYTILV
jgi:hypothetical protein